MTTELQFLTLAALWNLVVWVPYILNMISVRGLKDAVGYPESPPPMAPWAQRLKAAHYNGVENLVVFATGIVVAHLVGANSDATAVCAVVYFCARVLHTIVYAAAVPWLRTLTFAVAWLATLCIFFQILT